MLDGIVKGAQFLNVLVALEDYLVQFRVAGALFLALKFTLNALFFSHGGGLTLELLPFGLKFCGLPFCFSCIQERSELLSQLIA